MKHTPRIRITDTESRLTDSERVSLWGSVRTHMDAHPLPVRRPSVFSAVRSPFVAVMPFMRPLLSGVLIVVLAFGSTTTITWAAQAAMPGETLYTVKIASEQIRERFALSPEAKVVIAALRAERRLAEAVTLRKQSRLTSDIESRLQASFTEHVARITETLADDLGDIPLSETASAIARIEARLGAMEDNSLIVNEVPNVALAMAGEPEAQSFAADAGEHARVATIMSAPVPVAEVALMSEDAPLPLVPEEALEEHSWTPFIDVARATIETHEDVLRMHAGDDFDGIPAEVSGEIERVRAVHAQDERAQALIDVVVLESEEKDPIEVLKDIAALEVILEE